MANKGAPQHNPPRFPAQGGCDCPPFPHPRGPGGTYNNRFYDANNIAGGIVIATQLPMALLVDGDGDGLYDYQEGNGGFGTAANKADTDGDKLSDFEELYNRGTNPLNKDTDGDKLTDDIDPDPLEPNLPGKPGRPGEHIETPSSIQFRLEQGDEVEIKIFDVSGRLRRTVSATRLDEGEHTIDWDGMDDSGSKLPQGIYFAQITLGRGGAQQPQKLLLIR
jgi:hypothetical protein